jgi:uncharacterized damage-inducible protein DinB
MTELEDFVNRWNQEAEKTLTLLRALPTDAYEFRPEPGGRSIGELAWHLAEIDALVSYGIEQGKFDSKSRPAGIDRPHSISELAIGYERNHADSVGRLGPMQDSDLDRKVVFFTGTELPIRELLWSALLLHSVHHRGQLSILCRMAGGAVPGLFGPNREQMAVRRAQQAKES